MNDQIIPGHDQPEHVPTPVVYEDEEYEVEYKHMNRDMNSEGPLEEDDLNELGRDRWELAAAFAYKDTAHYYFRRFKS